MTSHRKLGILLALAGTACGETGAQGATGAVGPMGVVGPTGLAGSMGAPGIAGVIGPETLSLATDSCSSDLALAEYRCTVTCPDVGSIAIAHGAVSVEQPASGTVTFSGATQTTTDPRTYDFQFAGSGVEGTTSMTMTVVCFTPPT